MKCALSSILLALGLSAFAGVGAPAQEVPGRPEPTVRMLTFNVRYGTAEDGVNHWDHRREAVVATIRRSEADVVAIQEALDFQLAFLLEQLPGLRALGAYRDLDEQGRPVGEWNGVLVSRERFDVVGEGRFWLSEEPEEPGSVGWDAALPRICTWAVLAEKRTRGRFAVFSTHFDHRGAGARAASAALIVERAAQLTNAPTVVLGDLNAAEVSPPLEVFRRAGFRDSFRDVHPDAEEVGTYHAFRGGLGGGKIDHVLVDERWSVHAAGILHEPVMERFPSDHNPVFALLTRELRVEDAESPRRLGPPR